MEKTETVQPQKLQQEWVVAPEKEKERFLLRRADGTPISVKIPEEQAKNLERVETKRKLQTESKEAANIWLNKKLEPKSILKLTMPEGNTLYFESVSEPYHGQEKPNSTYVERIPITEDDFKVLSEKRKVYELRDLPATSKTRELFGIEEASPNKPQEGSFKAREGRKIDPESVRKSIKNSGWEKDGDEKQEPEKKEGEHYKGKGITELLGRIEEGDKKRAEEIEQRRQRRIDELKRKIAERKRELAEKRRKETYGVPEETRNYEPPSKRKRQVTETQQEAPQPQKNKHQKKKGVFERLFGL